MKKYNYEQLISLGYGIENALITKVDLSMADHGCLTLSMVLDGDGWGCRVRWLLSRQGLPRCRR